ncbi:DUF7737 domain-containing protein [Streptomyces sp. NPDC003006]
MWATTRRGRTAAPRDASASTGRRTDSASSARAPRRGASWSPAWHRASRSAIGDRCSVEGRFLRARGELHTYKIHRDPPGVGEHPAVSLGPVRVHRPLGHGAGCLPFEGDRTPVVVLSRL